MTDQTTHDAQDDPRNADLKFYLNGRIVGDGEAVVSIYDSGFMLGDGIWEGLRLYEGKWAFLDEHLDRLFEAAKAIDVNVPIYITAGISSRIGTEHPEWREITSDGGLGGWSCAPLEAGFKKLCFNTPYTDHLCKKRSTIRLTHSLIGGTC